jgi:type IV secretory pathway VirB2 component (pilin)
VICLIEFFKVIWQEMIAGNFSFAILVVGIIGVVIMIKNGRKDKRKW